MSNLSEEEKKAIEYLKENSIPILRYDNFGNILSPLYYGTFEKETLLNLIEKQQVEINKEKEKNKELEEQNKYIKNHIYHKEFVELYYIPKLRVKEKIEILEKHKQNIKPNTLDTAYKQAYCDGGIDSLNEIL